MRLGILASWQSNVTPVMHAIGCDDDWWCLIGSTVSFFSAFPATISGVCNEHAIPFDWWQHTFGSCPRGQNYYERDTETRRRRIRSIQSFNEPKTGTGSLICVCSEGFARARDDWWLRDWHGRGDTVTWAAPWFG